MALWLLEARDDLEDGNNPWSPWYDKTFGMVIRADSEKKARELGQRNTNSDENREGIGTPWLKKEYSKCTGLFPGGIKKVILVDFHSA